MMQVPINQLSASESHQGATEPALISQLSLLTPNLVERRIQALIDNNFQRIVPIDLQIFKTDAEARHGNVLYLNSSDSFRNIQHIKNIQGRSILTVAGSGDFLFAFIELGAKRVDVVDISLPACCFSELKLQALRHLTFAEYRKMFGTYIPEINEMPLERGKIIRSPIFDPTMYQLIRNELNEYARFYFDQIISRELDPLFKIGMIRFGDNIFYVDLRDEEEWCSPDFGLIRLRRPNSDSTERNNSSLSPFLTDQSRYEAVQSQLSNCRVSIALNSLDQSFKFINSYDYIYASNIGYEQSAALCSSLIQKGAKRVGFTFTQRGENSVDTPLSSQVLLQQIKGRLPDSVRLIRGIIDKAQIYGVYWEIASNSLI